MAAVRVLTDTSALDLHRRRALLAREPALFLHETALTEVRQRLADINRSFQRMAIVTGFPGFWAEGFPDARIVADSDPLELVRGSCDMVLHAMALHWANDPVGQLVQCRLALEPDGLLLAVCFCGETLAELRDSLLQAESRVCGGISPRIAPMGSLGDYGGLLQRAGLALPVADRIAVAARYASSCALLRDLRAMGESNALADRRKGFARRALFEETERVYSRRHADEAGRMKATFELAFLTGWSPGPGQPQPLKPGSAEARLADALSSVEQRLAR